MKPYNNIKTCTRNFQIHFLKISTRFKSMGTSQKLWKIKNTHWSKGLYLYPTHAHFSIYHNMIQEQSKYQSDHEGMISIQEGGRVSLSNVPELQDFTPLQNRLELMEMIKHLFFPSKGYDPRSTVIKPTDIAQATKIELK